MKKRSVLFLLFLALSVSAFSSTGKKEVRLIMVDTTSSLADESDVYLDVGVSPDFINIEDARKEFDSVSKVPQIYSLTADGVPCYSNSYGNFTRSVTIGLGFRVGASSTCAISATLLDNFDAVTIIQLEDRATGIFHDMRQGAYYFTLNNAQQTEGRLFLHISYPPRINPTPAGCANNDGVISVTEDSTILWSSCQLFDVNNTFISSYNTVKGNFKFSGLNEGQYNLAFVYGTYSAIKPLYVGGNQITASDSASTIYATTGQTISFFSHAHNASHYDWNFGDSTSINGIANIEYYYDTPGTYDVSVLCTNDQGCSAYAYITVYISQATSISAISINTVKVGVDRKQIIIFSDQVTSYTFEVYDLSGQFIANGPLNTSTRIIDLAGHSSGIYFVRIKDTDNSLTRKIFLE